MNITWNMQQDQEGLFRRTNLFENRKVTCRKDVQYCRKLQDVVFGFCMLHSHCYVSGSPNRSPITKQYFKSWVEALNKSGKYLHEQTVTFQPIFPSLHVGPWLYAEQPTLVTEKTFLKCYPSLLLHVRVINKLACVHVHWEFFIWFAISNYLFTCQKK